MRGRSITAGVLLLGALALGGCDRADMVAQGAVATAIDDVRRNALRIDLARPVR